VELRRGEGDAPLPDDPQSARRRASRVAQHLEDGASSPTNRHRVARGPKRKGTSFVALAGVSQPAVTNCEDAPPELDAGIASEIEAGAALDRICTGDRPGLPARLLAGQPDLFEVPATEARSHFGWLGAP